MKGERDVIYGSSRESRLLMGKNSSLDATLKRHTTRSGNRRIECLLENVLNILTKKFVCGGDT